MKYPDASLVRLGDLVWWDDENSIGRIVGIHETEEECTNWGVESPGVAICYDGSGIGGLFVGYPQQAFAEDGIRRLTPDEEREVNHVLQAARSYSSVKVDEISTGLFRKKGNESGFWIVVFYRDREALQAIEVDASNLSCRDISLKDLE